LSYTSYPHALHHLDLLQHATFRTEIATDQWREYLNQKQASLFFETSETKS
jgi:mediator of RNA polymerase II transcription subunit 31